MSVSLTVNGVTFTIPSVGETDWGQNVDDFFAAVASFLTSNVATKTGSETLTNKTLTSPTVTGGTFATPSITTPTIATSVLQTYTDMQQVLTPGVAPASGYQRVYPKSDGLLYSKSNAGTETALAPVHTGWTSFTPTGNWTTNCTYNGFWRRVGENMEVSARIQLGAAPGGTSACTFVLPNSKQVDVTKIADTTASQPLGRGILYDLSATTRYDAVVSYNNSTSVQVLVPDSSATYLTLNSAVNFTTPVTFASGDLVVVHFSVPISGWGVYT